MTRRVVVVGDAVLDRDVVGRVERLCPDAPVPVVDVEQVGQRPGGAALAALLLAQQGVEVTLAAGIGHDEAGLRLRGDLLGRVRVHDVLQRATTPAKTRVRSGTGPMLRLDDSGQLLGAPSGDPAGTSAAAAPGAGPYAGTDAGTDADEVDGSALDALLAACDGVLVADYGGPVTRHPQVREAVRRCAGVVPVVWDPHPRGLRPPAGVDVVTPNRAEAAGLLRTGGDADGPASEQDVPAAEQLSAGLLASLAVGAVVVTDGASGAVLSSPGAGVDGTAQATRVLPTVRLPAGTDTCGAGDRFAGRLLRGLVDGRLLPDALADTVDDVGRWLAHGGVAGATRPGSGPAVDLAARTALMPAGTTVGAPGLMAVGETVGAAAAGPAPSGHVADEDVELLMERVRAEGGTVVATGGCFDVLHVGHLQLLEQAAGLGSVLVVLINSDAGVRALKGPTRPVHTQRDRARLLRGLGCVDAVQIFDEADPSAALDRLRPDVWVKGGDYALEDLPEAATVVRHGGRVALLPLLPGRSTTAILTRPTDTTTGATA